MTTDVGALALPGCWGEVPVKSMTAERSSRSTRTATWMTEPSSVRTVLAVVQFGDDPAHGLLGVVPYVPHVGVHDVEAELVHRRAQFLRCPSHWRRSGRGGRRC